METIYNNYITFYR